MPVERNAQEIGLPRFEGWRTRNGSVFDLTSHTRAREALEFGLDINQPGFNIFVLGADNSGRMTQTLAFLKTALEAQPAPNDWVYLNNFLRPHRPKPCALPAGVGRTFRSRMKVFTANLHDALEAAFESEEYQGQVETIGEEAQETIREEMEKLGKEAAESDLALLRTEEGVMVTPLGPEGQPLPIDDIEEPRQAELRDKANEIADALKEVHREAAQRQMETAAQIENLDRDLADAVISDLLEPVIKDYGTYPGLGRWLTMVKADILDNLGVFQAAFNAENEDTETLYRDEVERRYSVNLFVDNGDMPCPEPIIEANPTFENLMGFIEYRSLGGELTTDFSMIRPGALHRANGGVLVLRAESLAGQAEAWDALKGALRDCKIRIEERHRKNGVRVAGSPTPKAIPLNLKIVLVGTPHWYYTFFSHDPDFRNHFKVKADIDPDMEASSANLSIYAGLLRNSAKELGIGSLKRPVLLRLLGKAARYAEDRSRLSARYELLNDLLVEASQLSKGKQITLTALEKADTMRRRRNARVEDRMMEQVTTGKQLIDVEGAKVGQVNALTILDMGDHSFGNVARVTSRASIGRKGLINIEHQSDMGGPLQQKSVLVLQGYLTGVFARQIPVAFNCTITFEQSYSGVEGDSATMAELLAVISDLAGVPLRQDMAVTGSANQLGHAQPVGGVREKVEAYFHTCQAKGKLSGKQGVVVPEANAVNLLFDKDIEQAIADGRFHIWTVTHVNEALTLFTDLEVGEPDKKGDYPADSLYGRVQKRLAQFDQILQQRETALVNKNRPQ
ncbi:Lon protease family protein [Aestuariispira ectoiniformans]|uniref:Lon protease family protein n=1 Tax=Aestuariispira ectoiniformans TaxID=2775080 RepID=UPI00223C4CBF|nr:AAA family ATPase [Aestuariispira ectoiniformans]